MKTERGGHADAIENKQENYLLLTTTDRTQQTNSGKIGNENFIWGACAATVSPTLKGALLLAINCAPVSMSRAPFFFVLFVLTFLKNNDNETWLRHELTS